VTVPEEILAAMQEHPYQCWLVVLPPQQADGFDSLATTAGIEPLGNSWHEVDREQAEAFLTALLHRSLAYHVEFMPEATAAWLAAQFLDSVGTPGCQFATNGEGHPGRSGFSWAPATDYTFDAGVAVIGDGGSVLYWVADED
jgi:hypothetical protein